MGKSRAVLTAFGKTLKTHYYNEVNLPAMWVNAPDDDIANDKNVADMIRVFPNMQTTTQTLQPKDYGLQHIGHMKFFSRQNQLLWQQTLDWLHQHG
jgi:predicted alpha/beta hydrolase